MTYDRYNDGRLDAFAQLDLRIDKTFYSGIACWGFISTCRTGANCASPDVLMLTGVVENPEAPAARTALPHEIIRQEAGTLIPTLNHRRILSWRGANGRRADRFRPFRLRSPTSRKDCGPVGDQLAGTAGGLSVRVARRIGRSGSIFRLVRNENRRNRTKAVSAVLSCIHCRQSEAECADDRSGPRDTARPYPVLSASSW